MTAPSTPPSPAAVPDGTTVVGPSPRWALWSWLVFGGFVALAALLAHGAVTKPPAGQTVAPSGLVAAAVLVAIGGGLRVLMARRAPHVRLTPEGLTGPGLPVPLAWADVRGARVYSVQIGRVTHHYVEPVMDAGVDDRYLAGLSAVRRAGWKSNRLKGLPALALVVTHLDRPPDEVARLVRTYAARYGRA